MTTPRESAIAYLKNELTALFPTNGVRVDARTIIGEENIHILYTHVTDKSQCVSGILENDRAYMRFVIWNDRDGTYYVEYPVTHMGRVFDGGVVKFRKIRGTTEQEVAEKLVSWFKKHQKRILAVGGKE